MWLRVAIATSLASCIYSQGELSDSHSSPPKLLQWPNREEFYKESEDVKLPCLASGSPTPLYKWEKNGVEFKPGEHGGRVVQVEGGTIRITDTQERDVGNYQCFATNQHGTAASPKIALQRAQLRNFPDEKQRSMFAKPGKSLMMRCQPPVSYPSKSSVVNWMRQVSGTLEPILLTDRIGLDYEGNLHFANILKSDADDNIIYKCSVSNSYVRRTVFGFPTSITIEEDSPQRHGVTLAYQSPTYTTALQGDTAKILCIFAGQPSPKVLWKKDDITLTTDTNPRVEFSQYGKELIIHKVDKLTDEGSYKCEGYNSESTTPAQTAFRMSVEQRPDWVDYPVDVVMAIGENATFPCNAVGSPSPYIQWYIDGKAITPNNQRDDVQIETEPKNVLRVINLSQNSTMVIQCNATNKHGSLFKNAYLNVFSVAPSWIEKPPESIKVPEGHDIVIPCRVFAVPKATVVWSKDGNTLTGGHYKILSNGSLEINNVNPVDAGLFACIASNVVTEDDVKTEHSISASGRLIVTEANSSASTTCTSSATVLQHTFPTVMTLVFFAYCVFACPDKSTCCLFC